MFTLFWRRLSLPLSVIGLLAFAGSQSAVSVPSKTSASEYHDTWRSLWEDHIQWTRSVIFGVFDLNTQPLLGNDPYTNRLLQNQVDMQEALATYYGQDANELGGLIRGHLVIAARILVGLRAGADVGGLIAEWYNNGFEIAVKMSEMNPQYWPLSHGDPMWREHLTATLNEAVLHFQGNYGAEVGAYDVVHRLALEMADFFSDGVTHQFPGRFSGPR